MELTLSHKNIKNTSTSGTISTEQLLNIVEDLRLLKRQENLHVTRQYKRKKKKKAFGWGLHPREAAVKEERFLNPRKSPHQQGDQTGWRGSFGT